MAPHTHPQGRSWSRHQLAAHISNQHPEHLSPQGAALGRWTRDELIATHDELHAGTVPPATLQLLTYRQN